MSVHIRVIIGQRGVVVFVDFGEDSDLVDDRLDDVSVTTIVVL